jgi:hypothetical protein
MISTGGNTDNKGKLFVILFDLPLHLDKFIITDASGHVQLPAT